MLEDYLDNKCYVWFSTAIITLEMIQLVMSYCLLPSYNSARLVQCLLHIRHVTCVFLFLLLLSDELQLTKFHNLFYFQLFQYVWCFSPVNAIYK